MAKVITDNQHYKDIADAIRAKTESGDSYKPSEMADAIMAIEGGGELGELEPGFVTPTGQEFTAYPDGAGFSSVTVAGDVNLEPQNIAVGVTIYGVEGTLKIGSSTGDVPAAYQPYLEGALNYYGGEYEDLMILESTNMIGFGFMQSGFAIESYNSGSSEFTASGWVYVRYNKTTGAWAMQDWSYVTSEGQNYVNHIRYCSSVLTYNGTQIYPVGGGGGSSGGGAGLNIAYGETAPEDTTKLWVKAAEPSSVEVTNDFGGTGEISTVATLPSALSTAKSIAFAAVGTKVYQIGGGGYSKLDCIHAFDTTTNTFEELTAKLPVAIREAGVAAWGSKVYVFGGQADEDLNTIYCFDTEANTVELLGVTMPEALKGMGVVTIGDKIYLFGGYYKSSGHRNKIRVFDPTENTITTLSTTMPINGGGVVLAAVGTKVYLFETSQAAQICVFNTETNTFDNVSDLPNLEFYLKAVASFGTKIYLFGGSGNSTVNYAKLDTIYEFNTTTNTLELLTEKLPVAANGISAVLVGGTIYLFGGETGTYVYTNLVNAFSVAAALESNKLLLLASLSANVFNLVDTGSEKITLGVQSAYLGDASGAAQPVDAFVYKDGEWTAI